MVFSAAQVFAEWTPSHFQSGGKPVHVDTCAPAPPGTHSAVIVLHGASPRGFSDQSMEQICEKLADQGFYAEFLEYYSQTDAVSPGEQTAIRQYFPTWLQEIDDGVKALHNSAAVGTQKIGIIGYSLGSFLALSYGASHPEQVSAIVDYYGGLPPGYIQGAANEPPVLILHGAADSIVPVSLAYALDRQLSRAGRPHEVRIYPGDNHAFNFPIPGLYKAADADDAWSRTLKFLDTYLKK